MINYISCSKSYALLSNYCLYLRPFSKLHSTCVLLSKKWAKILIYLRPYIQQKLKFYWAFISKMDVTLSFLPYFVIMKSLIRKKGCKSDIRPFSQSRLSKYRGLMISTRLTSFQFLCRKVLQSYVIYHVVELNELNNSIPITPKLQNLTYAIFSNHGSIGARLKFLDVSMNYIKVGSHDVTLTQQ